MQNIDELIEKTQIEDMLQFETQIFLDAVHKDGLVVAAKYVLNLQALFFGHNKVFTEGCC